MQGVFMSRWKMVALAAAAATVAGCWNPFGVDEGDPVPPNYHEYCDSAYKVVENLELAYVSKDLDSYIDCFRDDFEFHLLEQDWDDYNGDGFEDQYWGLDIEENFHETLFENVEVIELTFQGDFEDPWTQDTTATILIRTFQLKVYTDYQSSQGYQASGSAHFICRPDSTGEFYIWQWYDLSDL
jgi:hypothetical protein